jgi:hypothetical protein
VALANRAASGKLFLPASHGLLISEDRRKSRETISRRVPPRTSTGR